MAQQIGFAAPGQEEMVEVVTGLVGAGMVGVIEGVVVKMAPALGALDPIIKWGTLLGAPMVATAGALVTRGILGDFFKGAAAGGLGVTGYVLPELLAPITGRRGQGGGAGQLGQGAGIKQLGLGLGNAPDRAQQGARAVLEF